ncbi:MAG: NAD(P)H-hydrate dehydratase [Deltaproteobacteria bacterium]|nr:NAD(P)H-hydrate dehydratase [Deltaproteobacteria bacterium]
MRLVNAAEMRSLDQYAINTLGIPGVVLMELAGSATARAISERWEVKGSSVVVVCGKGNNGGDGYVVARHLHNYGAIVNIIALGNENDSRGESKTNLDIVKAMNIPFLELNGTSDIMYVEELFSDTDFIVDAIFGIGLDRPVTGLPRELISIMNSVSAVKISVDIPSGLSADTGEPLGGDAVQSDLTVTFGYPKIGHYTSPGFEYCGEIVIADISLPRVNHGDSTVFLLSDQWVAHHIPYRKRSGHKGTFGHSAVIGGSIGKVGAAVMAGESAVAMGSGLVTIIARENIMSVLMTRLTEEMCRTLETDTDSPQWEEQINWLIERSALAIGPGLGKDESARKLLISILESSEHPVIIDADALSIVADDPEILLKAKCDVILTPHPGEMAVLTKLSVKEIQASRHIIARDFAKKYNVHVILKGARTVIASPRGRIAVNSTGNPGMATGGSGDVLTGFVTALCAQGCSAFDAMCIGVFLHGRSGDLVAQEKGEIALKATDIIHSLSAALYSLGSQGTEFPANLPDIRRS